MNVKTINAVVALEHLVDIIISRIIFHCSIINETVDSSVVDNNLSRTEDSFIPTFVDQNEPHNSTADIHACNSIEDPSTLNPGLEFELSESLNEPTESIDTNTISKPTLVSSHPGYSKSYRESKEKEKNPENIIQSLASLIKQRVKQNLVDSVLSDVIVNVNRTSVHETTVVTNLIE